MTLLTMPTYPKKNEAAKVEEDDTTNDLRMSLNSEGEAARESRMIVQAPNEVDSSFKKSITTLEEE